jgi:hypothetical protein
VSKIALQPTRSNSVSLADLIDRILDKGLVINADITVSIAGVELLGIKIRAAIASFETAASYGLEFPSGTALPRRIAEERQVNALVEAAPEPRIIKMEEPVKVEVDKEGQFIKPQQMEFTGWEV